MLPDYEASVRKTVRQLEAYWGNEPGDPKKIAQVIVGVAEADRLSPHILLGPDVFQGALGADATRNAAAERWRAVSAWTDAAFVGPLPDFPSEQKLQRSVSLAKMAWCYHAHLARRLERRESPTATPLQSARALRVAGRKLHKWKSVCRLIIKPYQFNNKGLHFAE
jgi:hypothetical protein